MLRKIGLAILVFIFLGGSVLVLPWVLRLPEYIMENPLRAADLWIEAIRDSPLAATKLLLDDPAFRRIWLFAQPLVLGAFLWVLWQPGIRKRKKHITDGVGGPEASEYSITHGSSRWQKKSEINKNTTVWNTVRKPEKGGIVLGYDHKTRKAWLETRDFHTLLIGATRSGKTRRIIFPTIWHLAQAEESMIITDPKGELYERSRDYLEGEGYTVTLLDFRNPKRGNFWNPLDPVVQSIKAEDLPRASEQAWDIAHMIVHQKPQTGDPLWANGEESLIAALILAAAIEAPKKNKHMGTCYAMVSELGGAKEELVTVGKKVFTKSSIPLNDYIQGLPLGHLARAAYGTAMLATEKVRASFFTGAAADLRLWADPGIVHLTSRQGHCLKSAGREKTAVFLVIPDEKSTRHMLASLYIDQTYQALVELAIANKGRLPVRVNFLLDEFGNLPIINDFDKKLTVAGGRNMRFTLVIQDVTQLQRHYKESQQTITGNCHTWIYLLTADMETAQLVAAKTGQYTVETESYSSSVQTRGESYGSNQGTTGRALLLPDEVLRWPQDMSLVLQARQFPMKLPLPDLSRWRADKELESGEPEEERKIPNQVPVWIPGVKTAEEGGEQGSEAGGETVVSGNIGDFN